MTGHSLEMGTPKIFESPNKYFEAQQVSFILPLSLGSFQLGRHRIVTYAKQKCSFVPHSHASYTSVPFETFVLLSPPYAFLLEFYSSSSIHSVLLCERCIYFSTHGRRRTFGRFIYTFLIHHFDMYCFFQDFLLLTAFRILKSCHGIIYI